MPTPRPTRPRLRPRSPTPTRRPRPTRHRLTSPPRRPRRRATTPERQRPQRTCVGCRRVRDQNELIRIVRREGGGLDLGRTLPGRGAWLCLDTPTCARTALHRGALARALRVTVSPEEAEVVMARIAAEHRALPDPFDSGQPDARG